ncbi:MAG: ABC transporter substrate-binding protein [Bacillota bacterium]
MIKKLMAYLIIIALVGSFMTGCATKSSETAAKESEEIKIGAVLPLTGDVATFGESSKNALELLKEEVNSNGGVLGKKITFIYEDDENKPASSANAAQKLINNDNVVGLIGSVASKCSLAIGPIANAAKIPMITPTSTNPKVTTEGGEYVFRACFIDPFQGTVLAKFATEDLKAKKAAVLYDVANDYTKGLAEFFKKGFEELGGEIVAFETYNTGDTDFNAQLTNIKNTNPDVLLLPDYYNTVGLIAKQARALGIEAAFLGGDGWDSPDLFTVGGDAVNNGYFSNHFSPDDTSEEVVVFRKAFEAKYSKTPDALAGLAYDAGKILLAAIEKAGTTEGEKVKDALKATDMTVVSGHVYYDEDRNPIKGAVIIKTEDGKQKFAAKVNP